MAIAAASVMSKKVFMTGYLGAKNGQGKITCTNLLKTPSPKLLFQSTAGQATLPDLFFLSS